MANYRRIEVMNLSGTAGEVALVRFLDRKIIDAANIQEIGDELFALVEKELRKKIILHQYNQIKKVVTATIMPE